MATLRQKIDAEQRIRTLVEDAGLPMPDRIEYGYTEIRCFWDEPMVMVVIELDEPDAQAA